MEVKGQKRKPTTDTKQLCEPCGNLGKSSPAKGYCVDCREYFCQGCTDGHRGSKMSRSHKILCGTDMPASPLPATDDSTLLTDICSAHQQTKELIKFFCPSHHDVICGDCVVMSHRSCKVDYVIDVAKRYKGSQEFKDLNEFMAGIGDKLKRAEKIIQDVTKNSAKSKKEAMDEIIKLRTEVIAYFDKKQQELADEMDTVEADDAKVLQSKSVELVEKQTTLDTVKADIESKADSPNQLFIAATQNRPVLEELDKYANGVTKVCQSKRRNYKFKPNPDIEKLLKATKPLGTVVYDTETKPVDRSTTTSAVRDVRAASSGLSLCSGAVSCKNDGEIDVRTKKDINFCCIIGMVVLSPGKLAITDWYNSAVKLVDVGSRRVTARLGLSGDPWDLTLISPTSLAVTLYNNKRIQIVNVNKDNLTAGRSFRVSGECRGIDYNNNRLAVIYKDPVSVEIMDTKGAVQHVIKRDDTNKICGEYGYVMFTPSGQEVFVTCKDNCVRKLSLNGAVLATYTSNELRDPSGLAVTKGEELLVCGLDSGTVHVVGEEGEVRTLLTRQDGLYRPWALSLCEDTRTLYVSKYNRLDNDTLLCFKIK